MQCLLIKQIEICYLRKGIIDKAGTKPNINKRVLPLWVARTKILIMNLQQINLHIKNKYKI